MLFLWLVICSYDDGVCNGFVYRMDYLEGKEMTQAPTYTDPETKEKLYGYSQTSLDELRKTITMVFFAFIVFNILMIVVAWFIVDYFNLIDYIAFKMNGGC